MKNQEEIIKEKVKDILEDFAMGFASKEVYTDCVSWWGHDTDLGEMKEEFNLATKDILELFQAQKQELEAKYKFGLRNLAAIIEKKTKQDLLKEIKKCDTYTWSNFSGVHNNKAGIFIKLEDLEQLLK